MDDLHLIKLNQQLVQNILLKTGAKSLGVYKHAWVCVWYVCVSVLCVCVCLCVYKLATTSYSGIFHSHVCTIHDTLYVLNAPPSCVCCVRIHCVQGPGQSGSHSACAQDPH